MKLAIVLLVLLPMAFAVPQKRFISGTFSLALDALKTLARDLLDVLGSGVTEEVCEAECHKMLQPPYSSLPHTICIPVCRSLQALIELIPEP